MYLSDIRIQYMEIQNRQEIVHPKMKILSSFTHL